MPDGLMLAPFRYHLRVRYSECDAQKVVFNSRYSEYVDVGVNEFLRAAGVFDQFYRGNLDFQLVKQTIEWKAPALERRLSRSAPNSESPARIASSSPSKPSVYLWTPGRSQSSPCPTPFGMRCRRARRGDRPTTRGTQSEK